MDKLTLYKKGGVLYYKKGGKMCKYEGGGPIKFRKPKYQNGGPYSTTEIEPIQTVGTGYQIKNPYVEEVVDRNVPSIDNNSSNNKFGQTANWINTIGAGLSMVKDATTDRPMSNNPYVTRAFGDKQKRDAVSDASWNTAGSIVSSINPVIGAVVNTGRGVSDMIAGENKETGIANPVRRSIAGFLSPSSNTEEAIKTGVEFGAGYGLLQGLFHVPVGDVLRQQKKDKADAELKWDENRKAMFNSENTGIKRNDTIYAQSGAYLNKSNNADWNAEVEGGEILMGDTDNMTIDSNASSSMKSSKAVKVNGKSHAEGGILTDAPSGTYVFSDHLTIDGNKAKKGEKTVAKLATPHAKALAKMEKNPNDRYLNNPMAKQHHENQLELLAQKAEQGKQNKMFSDAIKAAKNGSINGLQYAQAGGPLGKLNKYAKERMGVNPELVDKAQQDDPAKYPFINPDLFEGDEYDSYNNQFNIPADQVKQEVTVEPGVELPADNRVGNREDITTIDQQAGKSPYTGTSNLIQEKIREMIGEDVFDESGKLSPQWKDKLVNKYNLTQGEVDNAQMETITEGRVGKVFGELLRDAYGVMGKGKDEQSRLTDINVSGKTDRPVINNKIKWADNIIDDIKSNGNILPGKYSNLPEDLTNTLVDLARSNKSAMEGKFSPSLDRAYTAANESVASEINRQKSLTYKTDEQSGQKLDSNYDLQYNLKDGSVQSFGAAFRQARDGGLPTFTYKGRKYSTKTESEAPELAIKNSKTQAPINELTIKPKEQMKSVVNPTRKLTPLLKTGGFMSNYQMGGELADKARIRAIIEARNTGKQVPQSEIDWYNNHPGTKWKISGGSEQPRQMLSTSQIKPIISPVNTLNDALGYQAKLQNQAGQLEAERLNNRAIEQAKYDALIQSRKQQPYLNNPVNVQDKYSGKNWTGKNTDAIYQEGGEMPEQMPNESNEHMAQLMSGQAEQSIQQPQPAQGQMPMQLAELAPQLQQIFMQLSPEQQQQILALPPDQIEIALMTMAQQMAGGAQQPQAPIQQPTSEVPMGVQQAFM